MTTLIWEKIRDASSGSEVAMHLWRTPTPTGWLVSMSPGPGATLVVVNDPGHTWGATAKPVPHSDDVFIDFQCAVGDEDSFFKIQSDGDTATLVEITGGDRSNALGGENHVKSSLLMTPEAKALVHVAHKLQEEEANAK